MQRAPVFRWPALSTRDARFRRQFARLLERDQGTRDDVETTVGRIVSEVRSKGDRALLAFTRRFDGVRLQNARQLEISRARVRRALQRISRAERSALQHAADRISEYHRKQLQESWAYREPDGTLLGQRVTPLERVGLYVPGGKAAYPSSVLMNAIPAKVAGVRELIMAVPTPRGEINESVLAAAALAGVDRVFRMGGAQAVAALAYGTATVPAVDKIVGPGNIYVATAKRRVFGQVGIDMIAGPSEVVVVCDDSVDPNWVAMDLFAQAEHDELAQSIVISTSSRVIRAVRDSVARLLPTLERSAIAGAALAAQGASILARGDREAAALVDRIAPEHLEILVSDPAAFAARVRNAGAMFLGPYSAEALGDYCAGPNHVLPTAGTARFSSPLGVYDFQKKTSVIQCSPSGADRLARSAEVLARAEGLTAHARAAAYRRKR